MTANYPQPSLRQRLTAVPPLNTTTVEAKPSQTASPANGNGTHHPSHHLTPSDQPTPRFSPPIALQRLPLLATTFVFLLSLTVYALTAYPSVAGGDSGGLVIASCELSVEHPPGYPTIVMLTGAAIRLAALLFPSASPAFVANLVSAVLGSVCVALVQRCCWLLSGNVWASMAAALGFGLSPTVWLYSIQAEVFALNNVAIAALMLVTTIFVQRVDTAMQSGSRQAEWKRQQLGTESAAESASVQPIELHQTGDESSDKFQSTDSRHSVLRYASALALLSGLSMTNQHTAILYILPTAAVTVWFLHRLRLLTPAAVVRLTVIGFLGLLPYLYVVVSALSLPRHTWGDQRTLSGFFTHLTRAEYGTFQLAVDDKNSPNPGMLPRMLTYANLTLDEGLSVFPVLGVCGLVAMLRSRRRHVRWSSAVQLLCYSVYMLIWNKLANLDLSPFNIGVQARFWQQPNMCLYVWAAVGIVQVCGFLTGENVDATSPDSDTQPADADTGKTHSKARGAAPSLHLSFLVAVVSVMLCLTQVSWHWHRLDHSGLHDFHHYATRLLDSLPDRSLILLNGDLNHGVVRYAQSCEGRRPDVQLLSGVLMAYSWWTTMQSHHHPSVTFPGSKLSARGNGTFNLKQFLDSNIEAYQLILACTSLPDLSDTSHANNQTLVPPSRYWYYDEVPYGPCKRLRPALSDSLTAQLDPADVLDDVRAGLQALVPLDELLVYDPVRDTDDTWEAGLLLGTYVSYLDSLSATVSALDRRVAPEQQQQQHQRDSDVEVTGELVELAVVMAERLLHSDLLHTNIHHMPYDTEADERLLLSAFEHCTVHHRDVETRARCARDGDEVRSIFAAGRGPKLSDEFQ